MPFQRADYFLRTMPYGPLYERVNELQTLLCLAVNAGCMYGGASYENDVLPVERRALVKTLQFELYEAIWALMEAPAMAHDTTDMGGIE